MERASLTDPHFHFVLRQKCALVGQKRQQISLLVRNDRSVSVDELYILCAFQAKKAVMVRQFLSLFGLSCTRRRISSRSIRIRLYRFHAAPVRGAGSLRRIQPAFQGLISTTPVPLKSRSLRVASMKPWAVAIAAIAAIATAHGFMLATRNERDFKGTGVVLINPWKAG